MLDSFGRTIDYARISVTDRCNLRCVYCLPSDHEQGDEKSMSLDQILRVGAALADLGFIKFKITGGEPTVRSDIVKIVKGLKNLKGVKNITLTTNGLLLEKLAVPLVEAGLNSINISLDSLDDNYYRSLTRLGSLPRVLAGLEAAAATGLSAVKINCVPQSQTTENDILALTNLAKEKNIHVRFIELMPIGPGASLASHSPQVVKSIIEKAYGPLTSASLSFGNGPAVYYSLKNFKGLIGFISALHSRFCQSCNRLRITSDGCVKTCLHMDKGRELPFEDEKALREVIIEAVKQKPERHFFETKTKLALADDRLMSRIGG
ncbi:MAG: GTP 3',8-cyclase MoaA [Deltaproteobacteria bacterium]|jgi:cyclic pyranopterin phosphate synthase|nr:GTP 3',8-cyclase MoaA [Deltaproteobacteria bacterium]